MTRTFVPHRPAVLMLSAVAGLSLSACHAGWADGTAGKTGAVPPPASPYATIANGKVDIEGGVVEVAARRAGVIKEVLVQEGDSVTIDAARGELRINVADRVLATRRAKWKAPAPRYTSGVLAKYARLVSSSSHGAVTDA